MLDFTFLTKEQIFEKNNSAIEKIIKINFNISIPILNFYFPKQLNIKVKCTSPAAITDFAMLLGGASRNSYTNEGARSGFWWTKSKDKSNNKVCTIDYNGISVNKKTRNRKIGARPAITYSSISQLTFNEIKENNDINEINFGEYPQSIVSRELSLELEKLYSNGNLNITGKHYTTDSIRYKKQNNGFQTKRHIEYIYKGQKYIRFIGYFDCNSSILSDGRTIRKGEVYWITVEPIIWLVNLKSDIALSKKILFAGIPFDTNKNYNGKFNQTNIKKFLDDYFAHDIIPSKLSFNKIQNNKDRISNIETIIQNEQKRISDYIETIIQNEQKRISNIETIIQKEQDRMSNYIETIIQKEQDKISNYTEIINQKEQDIENMIQNEQDKISNYIETIIQTVENNSLSNDKKIVIIKQLKQQINDSLTLDNNKQKVLK